MTLKQYLAGAIAGFANDPADTDFQRGYKAALEEVLKCLEDGTIEIAPQA